MPDQVSQPQGGGAELASFGEELRREREIRGISLKEISDATKISKRFLEALERNDHKTLPAPVFTRGFVREYARYVGLNAEDMVNRYNFAAAHDERIEKPPQVAKYPVTPVRDITPKPPPKRGIPSAFARVDKKGIAVFITVLALAGVAWWAVQYKRQRDAAAAEAAASVPVTTRVARPIETPPVAPAPKPPDDSMLRLTVVTTASSWVTLEADGKTLLNAEMSPGQTRNFEANEQFRFRTIGNAAGLRLTLNGTEIPQLGEDGEVIKNRIFDREMLSQIRAAGPGQGNP